MNRTNFVFALQKETHGVRVSSGLRQRTLARIYGEEQTFRRKRAPAIVLAALLSLLLCATALAVASRAGMLDYQALFPNTYIPADAQDTIQTDVMETGNELINLSVREAYYDGRTARVTVDITAKDKTVFLGGFDTTGDDLLKNLNRLNPDFDETGERTVAEFVREDGYTSSYCVTLDLNDPNDETLGASGDYFYTSPGVLTFFYQVTFEKEASERTVDFNAILSPLLDSEGSAVQWNDDRIWLRTRLSLSSASEKEKIYVSAEPAVFSSTGITVEQMQLFVKPQELYVRLYYTVSDGKPGDQSADSSEALYELPKENFVLEIIDSESVSEDPNKQSLSEGPTGSIASFQLSEEGETPVQMVCEFTLGLNELRDSYTLCVFDCTTKIRYDTVTVVLREASAEDLISYSSFR